MDAAVSPFPDDVEALKALLAVALERAEEAEARAANAEARESAIEATITHLKLQIAKLRREQFGPSAERSRRLLDQMEFELADLEADASEDDLAAEAAAAKTSSVVAFERKRPARKPFPEHLPRERIVVPAPCSCPACGGTRLSKLGEDVTETLEVIPRAWKVVQTVREKFACRDCEKITQPPAPFHVVPRGWAGPSFLAMLLFEKYGQHQPLNRQAERFAREGVPLSVSTLADQVGAVAFALMPLYRRIEAHVLSAQRLHGDDTTVPVMARGKTDIARLWVYVHDDRPYAGTDPPAALFHYSRDRRGGHPCAHLATWSGILQADAYGGYNELYVPGRQPGPVLEAGCFAHARRKFFELADVEGAARKRSRGERTGMVYPIALEAVQRLDALFEIERTINGRSAAERLAARQELSAPLMLDLHAWLVAQRPNSPGCRATTTSPRPSTTCCVAGMRSRASSVMAGSVSRTTRQSARCAVSRSGGKPGCSAGQIAADSVPPSSTPSSRPHASTMSTRRPGSPTSSPASPTTPSVVWTSCCLGTGNPAHQLSLPERLAAALAGWLPCGSRRWRWVPARGIISRPVSRSFLT
jgi:transposase